MIGDALSQAGIVALVSMFMGVVPLGLAVVYAFWPAEHRLALLRPLSLATICAVISGTALGVLNALRTLGVSDPPPPFGVFAIALAESLVPIFFGFGCLTVTWLCVTFGLWRRP